MMHIESYVDDMKARLNALPEKGRSKLAAASGVGESTIRLMASPDWLPRTVANLAALERALPALEAERSHDPCGQRPEAGGDGCADDARALPHGSARPAQGDEVSAGADDGALSHAGDPDTANGVRRLESDGGVQQ